MKDIKIYIVKIKSYFVDFDYSGSVDGGNQLIIKGRFQQKQIENVLRRYISKLCKNYFLLLISLFLTIFVSLIYNDM